MNRVGVENRFQLALVLGASRAVPLPPVDPNGSVGPGSSADASAGGSGGEVR
jgi:hypothetical protein